MDTKNPEVEIRRYSNRRFYDTSRSRHVTLEEIRDMIRDGTDVSIVDAPTGEDITSRVLTQIILEFDERKIAVLPAVMLHRLIRSSESLLLDFISQYFTQATRLFQDSQQAARDQWMRLMPFPGDPAPWWPTAGREPPPAPPARESAPDTDDLKQVIAQLREQLQDVQAEMKDLRGGENPTQRKPAAKAPRSPRRKKK
ncbi:MAG: hypothetical protein H7A53_13015 [Akkermansiaceae bacterium]|nr:hypothetical protein [Akkermansiaceae bacterium]MCP5551802.1 hypothetical protein [Akkermansiaceae bacterium]